MRIPAAAGGLLAGVQDALKAISSRIALRTGSAPLRLLLAAALLWLSTGWLAGQDYQGAITAAMSDIQAKEAELQIAQRELDTIVEFRSNYDANTTSLNTARQQLLAADAKLASMNKDNLTKLMMKMGLETVCTISEAVGFGQAAVGGLVTSGLKTAAIGVGLDRLQGALTNAGKANLGVDDETLTHTRTKKIKAVSDAARLAFPELNKVQDTLRLSLDAVRAANIKAGGEPFSADNDTGPILYKNAMVRDAIYVALGKLDDVSTKAVASKTDADIDEPAAQLNVDHLKEELAALKTYLETLKADWSAEEAAARLATNLAAVVPPANQGPAAATISTIDGESAEARQTRLNDAIKAAAVARWNAECPPLLAALASLKAQILTAQAELDTGVATHVTVPDVELFIETYGGNAKANTNTIATYTGSASSYAEIERWINKVAPFVVEQPAMVAKAEALADLYTALRNKKNEYDSLVQMVAASNATVAGVDGNLLDINVGNGQVAAECVAAILNQDLFQIPQALANARSLSDQFAAATDAWSGGIGALGTDIDTNLAAAEDALAELITRGAAWEALLAAADGLVLEPLNPGSNDGMNPPRGRLGYYSSNGTGNSTYTSVVLHAFDMPTYNKSMLDAIDIPGAAGLAAAQALREKYNVLVAAAPAIKSAYDAAWLDYQAAYQKVAGYAGKGAPSLPVLSDWTSAAGHNYSVDHPIDASSVTDQAARYSDLYYTSNAAKWTNMTGDGPPVENLPQLYWSGLPGMKQLTDPGLDDPATYLPHRLAAMKATIVVDGETWIPLPLIDFDSHRISTSEAVWVLIHLGEAWAEDYLTTAMTTTATKLLGEMEDLNTAYYNAHPKPTITAQPVGGTITSGGTFQLSVTATSDLLTYQWSMSMSDDANGGWQVLTGETAGTLTSPALTGSRWFHVIITNPGGSVTSEDAHVIVTGGTSSSPAFTSANSTTGQVGTPFTWTFTTSPAGMINIPPITTLPPGLAFGNGTLSGTPTTAGTWDLTVNVSIAPNPPNPPGNASQSFRLTIALPPFDAWVESWTTVSQRLSSAFTSANGMPAGDGVANLLKYAFNMVGNGAGQVASLDIPSSAGLPVVGTDGSGHLTLLYSRRKAGSQPGITYQVEFSSTIAPDSWSVNASASEAATPVDATWESVLVTDSVAGSRSRFVRVRVNKP